jgi:hypothetical protein
MISRPDLTVPQQFLLQPRQPLAQLHEFIPRGFQTLICLFRRPLKGLIVSDLFLKALFLD